MLRLSSVVFSALELVPVFKRTARGNVGDQCEVRILGNPLGVQDTLGHWPSGQSKWPLCDQREWLWGRSGRGVTARAQGTSGEGGSRVVTLCLH